MEIPTIDIGSPDDDKLKWNAVLAIMLVCTGIALSMAGLVLTIVYLVHHL